jgi:hypothetical protein
MTVELIHGDCRQILEFFIEDNSIDAIVCDPPYELGFMGKSWDATGIAYSVAMWRECLRVLKPGGHMLAFSGSRTYHRMACAIEDAGFEIRDQVMWVYGSGFPKSHDVSKAIDKAAGAERNVIGRQWAGFGTALKPAHEPICVARKPLVGTVVANVLQFGTGALNIDGCKVPVTDAAYARNCSGDRGHGGTRGAHQEGVTNLHTGGGSAGVGRWPANIIHDGSDEVVALFPAQAEASAASVGRVTGERERVAGVFHADSASAARFFYCAKANKADRGEGNTHPTVKPTDLLAYLCRLVTPPGGRVLDPFMGSGSTGKACVREGFDFTGIEQEQAYIDIAQARIAT